MSNENNIWTPNSITGFLPSEEIPSLSELDGLENTDLKKISIFARDLGSKSDLSLEHFVSTLTGDLPDPSNVSDAMSEAIVRAYTNIAVHFIHRPHFKERQALPPAIAVPLWDFSKKVGRQPSLTYASYVLANFEGFPRPRMNPEEFLIAQTPSGTPDEEWFVAAHLAVESTGGEVMGAIRKIETALDSNDTAAMVEALNIIESSMGFSAGIMPGVMKGMDPVIFREKIRPLLHGHGKVVFQGVEGNPSVTYIGETGAQSGVIRAVDLLLAVVHEKKIQDPIDRFATCAPPAHQKAFAEIKRIGERLSLVNNTSVFKAIYGASENLYEFRRNHSGAVDDYLTQQGKELAVQGTGGTHFRNWLGGLIRETKERASNSLAASHQSDMSNHP